MGDDELCDKLFTCTWGALVDASDAGCPTCQIIRQGVRATEEWTDPRKEQNMNVRRQKGAVFLHFWPPRNTVFELLQTSRSSKHITNYILYLFRYFMWRETYINMHTNNSDADNTCVFRL
jgi:hypothetical protein